MAGEPERRGPGSLQDVIERLARAGFQLLPTPQILTHFVLERDGFIALVERLPDNTLGRPGFPGILQENTFAALVWKHDQAVFVSKGREVPATPEELAALRQFDADLQEALGSPSINKSTNH